MFQRYLSISPAHQPLMVRPSYLRELRASGTFPLAAALSESAFTGVVAAKYFAASPTLIAVLIAAPMFGNILAVLWAEVAKDRPKVQMMNGLQAGVVVLTLAVAVTYWMPQVTGAWVYAGLIVGSRLLISGIITVNGVIWRMNYPDAFRGQIVSRLQMVQTAAVAVTALVASSFMEWRPITYTVIYPVLALLGLIGMWQYSKLRVRKEPAMLRRVTLDPLLAEEREAAAIGTAVSFDSGQAPLMTRVRDVIRESFNVLRQDKLFRRYQWLQFVMGASFMLQVPVTIQYVSKTLTDEKTDYLLATIVLQVIPAVATVIFSPIWAPIFDKLHVLRYRVVHGAFSTLVQVAFLIGALTGQLWVMGIATAMQGVSMAGGALAWKLGQNDFAPPERIGLYMGVHVMLTGLRGSIVPFVGAILLSLTGRPEVIYTISIALAAVSWFGFVLMTRNRTYVKGSMQEAPRPSMQP